MAKTFLRLGLTGGIASGKSLAAGAFAALGCGVVDADALSRSIVEKGGDALQEIREAFGEDVLTADGALDREAMRARVFGDDDARLRLEAIVHPRVYTGVRDAFARFEREGRPAGLVEAALLMERPAPYGFDAIIVVICGAELQAARLHKRSGWSEPEIRGVLAAQLTDDERIARADYVLRNDGTPEDLNAAARALWKKLTV